MKQTSGNDKRRGAGQRLTFKAESIRRLQPRELGSVRGGEGVGTGTHTPTGPSHGC